eukprot:3504792-Amphidinium_carterae.1
MKVMSLMLRSVLAMVRHSIGCSLSNFLYQSWHQSQLRNIKLRDEAHNMPSYIWGKAKSRSWWGLRIELQKVKAHQQPPKEVGPIAMKPKGLAK